MVHKTDSIKKQDVKETSEVKFRIVHENGKAHLEIIKDKKSKK